MTGFGGGWLALFRLLCFGPGFAVGVGCWLCLAGVPVRLAGAAAVLAELGPVAWPDVVLCRTGVGAVARVMVRRAGGHRVALAGGGDGLHALALLCSRNSVLARVVRGFGEGCRIRRPGLFLLSCWGGCGTVPSMTVPGGILAAGQLRRCPWCRCCSRCRHLPCPRAARICHRLRRLQGQGLRMAPCPDRRWLRALFERRLRRPGGKCAGARPWLCRRCRSLPCPCRRHLHPPSPAPAVALAGESFPGSAAARRVHRWVGAALGACRTGGRGRVVCRRETGLPGGRAGPGAAVTCRHGACVWGCVSLMGILEKDQGCSSPHSITPSSKWGSLASTGPGESPGERSRRDVGRPAHRRAGFSFGSNQGVAHGHWHLAPLPPSVPFAEQQFAAVPRAEQLIVPAHGQAVLAENIRQAMRS